MKRSRLRRKSKSESAKLKDELWELCKKITRLRHGHNCYTCGNYVKFPHTGHFIPSSVCSTELDYSLDNLRPQCMPCNIWKSGNWVVFERNLIRDGISVEKLKIKNERTKGKQYDSLWYRKMIRKYNKILEKENDNQTN